MLFRFLIVLLICSSFEVVCQYKFERFNTHLGLERTSWIGYARDTIVKDSFEIKSKVLNRFLNKDWIEYADSNSRVQVNPIIELSGGNQSWVNTRGAQLKGEINKIRFVSRFTESQSDNFDYIDEKILVSGVFPSGGRVRPFGEGAWDYAKSMSEVTYSPNKIFDLELGYSNHFIGNGFRSLLMDQSNFSYPYFSIATKIGKVVYHNLYTKYLNISDRLSPTEGFNSKFGSFQVLEWEINNKLSVSFFQGIIQGNDSVSKRQVLDVNYWNPLIFMRPVEFSMGSPDNAMVGYNFNYQPITSILFYHQFLIDDINVSELKKQNAFFQNKFGWQLGLKYFNKFDSFNISLGTEYNEVRPYVYGHKYPIQSYTHHGESLGHQLGGNLKELISWISLNRGRWSTSITYLNYIQGIDIENSHFGSNIFLSDFDSEYGEVSSGNILLQGNQKRISLLKIEVKYSINQYNNMECGATFTSRNSTISQTQETKNYINLFLRANINRKNEMF